MRTPLSPFGDEVAPFSAARHRAELAINAFISPRSFDCGCAALRGCAGQTFTPTASFCPSLFCLRYSCSLIFLPCHDWGGTMDSKEPADEAKLDDAQGSGLLG